MPYLNPYPYPNQTLLLTVKRTPNLKMTFQTDVFTSPRTTYFQLKGVRLVYSNTSARSPREHTAWPASPGSLSQNSAVCLSYSLTAPAAICLDACGVASSSICLTHLHSAALSFSRWPYPGESPVGESAQSKTFRTSYKRPEAAIKYVTVNRAYTFSGNQCQNDFMQ